ncbi:RNA polymerase sigma factor, partial [Dysosmobacter welbionis]
KFCLVLCFCRSPAPQLRHRREPAGCLGPVDPLQLQQLRLLQMLRRLGQGAAVHAVVRQHGKPRHLPPQLPQVFPPQLRLGPQLCHPLVLVAVPLQDPRLPLGWHRHEGPLVCVGGIPQLQVAQLLPVPLPWRVLAGAALCAADGAHPPGHAAPYADLPLDASLDLRDQIRVFLRPQQISPGLQPAVA